MKITKFWPFLYLQTAFEYQQCRSFLYMCVTHTLVIMVQTLAKELCQFLRSFPFMNRGNSGSLQLLFGKLGLVTGKILLKNGSFLNCFLQKF